GRGLQAGVAQRGLAELAIVLQLVADGATADDAKAVAAKLVLLLAAVGLLEDHQPVLAHPAELGAPVRDPGDDSGHHFMTGPEGPRAGTGARRGDAVAVQSSRNAGDRGATGNAAGGGPAGDPSRSGRPATAERAAHAAGAPARNRPLGARPQRQALRRLLPLR